MATTPVNPKYDPSNPNPYVAPAMPEPTPAMPSPIPTEGPQISGAVRKSGAVATIADGMLRGFMNGRAMGQAQRVMKLKKKTDDLQASYQQDAQRLVDLTKAGVGPDNDEYKRAKSAVEGSWGALMDFYGQHLEPQQTGKKKGVGGKVKAGLMEMFGSQDPAQVSQAWYQVAQKAGPPVFSQVAMLNTPQAKAERETLSATAQANLQEAQQTVKYQQVIQKPQGQWSQDERDFIDQYNSLHGKASDELIRQKTQIAQKVINNPNYNLTPSEQQILNGGKPESVTSRKRYGKNPQTGADEEYQIDMEGNEIPDTRRPLSSASNQPKMGTFGDFMVRKYGPQYSAQDELTGLKDWFASRRVGIGHGAGTGMEKRYWDAVKYYHDLYPDMMPEEIDAMARRKTEGAGQLQSGNIAHDAMREPQQFDNDVISAAIDNLRRLPQYQKMATLDDALANIVGLGDSGYQYHKKTQLGAPDKHGKYSGDVDESQLKAIERDLQNQIRVVLSSTKLTSLSPAERRSVLNRLTPVFGPAAQGSGATPASPQAHAATPQAAPSSAPPVGGNVVTPSYHGREVPGMVKQGNVDLSNRPDIKNPDGSHSTVFSMSFGTDEGEVLVPGVGDGKTYPLRKLTKQEALDQYHKTGKFLGIFKDAKSADAYGAKLHEDQASSGPKKQSKGTVKKSAFLKANPGSTEADWKAMKPQLESEGYDTKDE